MAITTSFKQECPSCEGLVLIKDPKLVGKKIECPKCKFKFVVKEPPPKEEEEEKEEEGVTSRPSKKAKTAGTGKVTDKKPVKAGAKKGKDDDTDGDDDGTDVKKKKKKKSGPNMMVVGGGLGVVALIVLGIVAYARWGSSDPPKSKYKGGPVVPVVKNPGVTEVKKDPDNTVVTPGVKSSPPAEATNLLPAEATAVFAVNVRELRKSEAWKSAVETPGAFNKSRFEEIFGFPLSQGEEVGVERVVTATNAGAGWSFSVVRTLHDVDEASLKSKLKLTDPVSINNRRYYLVGRQFDAVGNLLIKANRSHGKFAVCIVDAKTLVFADVEPLKKFMEDGSKPAEKGTYQKLNPELKALLDKTDRSDAPALICLAGDVDMMLNATQLITPNLVKQVARQLAPHIAKIQIPNFDMEFDKLVKEAGVDPSEAVRKGDKTIREEAKNAAVALTTFEKNKLVLVVALELKSDKTSELWHTTYIKTLLDIWAAVLATPPPTGTTDTTKKEVPIEAKVTGKVLSAIYTTPLKPTEHTQFMEDLGKVMVESRGDADLANTSPRYHQLAAALSAYVEKTGQFPRGTAERPAPDYSWPESRVSWMAALLPYLPDGSFSKLKVDPNKDWFRDENLALARMVVPHFVVRTKDAPFRTTYAGHPDQFGVTHFAGMAGLGLEAARYRANDESVKDRIGIFGYDRITTKDALKGRLDKVIALIQVPPEFHTPWLAGGGATVRGVDDDERSCVQPFVCAEYKGERGTFAIMADGTVRFIKASIAPALFRAMCTLKGTTENIDKSVPEVPNEGEAIATPAKVAPEEKPAPAPKAG